MDFPANDDGTLSYQRRYQMTQQQRINRFRQQRNFRSLRDPPFNYSGTSTYERDTEDEEQQALMRPTSPSPVMASRGALGWSPDLDRHSSPSWRGSSSREKPPKTVRTRQPRLRDTGTNSSSNNSSRSRDDVIMVESNNVSVSAQVGPSSVARKTTITTNIPTPEPPQSPYSVHHVNEEERGLDEE